MWSLFVTLLYLFSLAKKHKESRKKRLRERER